MVKSSSMGTTSLDSMGFIEYLKIIHFIALKPTVKKSLKILVFHALKLLLQKLENDVIIKNPLAFKTVFSSGSNDSKIAFWHTVCQKLLKLWFL
jgi:hypothetical protein